MCKQARDSPPYNTHFYRKDPEQHKDLYTDGSHMHCKADNPRHIHSQQKVGARLEVPLIIRIINHAIDILDKACLS